MRDISQYPFLMLILFLAGCTNRNTEEIEIDCSLSDLSVSVVESTQPGCTAPGSITVAGSGGTSPYTFSINAVDFQSGSTFTDLSGGSFSITVLDADGCTNQTSFNLEPDESAVSINIESTTSKCLEATGSITVNASGGDGSYQYALNGGVLQEVNTFSNVSAGSHEVTVVDGSDCEAVRETIVRTDVSLAGDIMPLLQAQCTFAGCHNGDNGADRNWTQKEDVLAKATGIKERTQSGSMPRSPGVLTQAEIDLIACWVDDGAEDN